MIIGILAALLIVFGSHHGSMPIQDLFDQLEKTTKHAVTDPARREAAEKELKQMTEVVKAFEKQRGELIKSLEKVGENHDATADDLQTIFEANSVNMATARKELVALQKQLKTNYTEAEWAVATAPPAEKKK